MEFSSSTTHMQTFSQTTKIVGGKYSGWERGSGKGSLSPSTSTPWVDAGFVNARPSRVPRYREQPSPNLRFDKASASRMVTHRSDLLENNLGKVNHVNVYE